jgi:hypothetical protein
MDCGSPANAPAKVECGRAERSSAVKRSISKRTAASFSVSVIN